MPLQDRAQIARARGVQLIVQLRPALFALRFHKIQSLRVCEAQLEKSAESRIKRWIERGLSQPFRRAVRDVAVQYPDILGQSRRVIVRLQLARFQIADLVGDLRRSPEHRIVVEPARIEVAYER